MEDKELIDYYEDLFGQLQEIEAKLPGLREEVDGIHKVLGVIQETKVSFEKEVQEKQLEFEKTAKSHRDNISKLTSSNLKKITDHAQAKSRAGFVSASAGATDPRCRQPAVRPPLLQRSHSNRPAARTASRSVRQSYIVPLFPPYPVIFMIISSTASVYLP